MSRPTTSTVARRRKGAAQVLLLVLVLAAAAAVATLTGSVSPPPASASGAAVGSGSAGTDSPYGKGLVAQGKRVFLRDCAWCHGDKGEGTQNAPSIDDKGPGDADFYLRTGRMPLKSPDSPVVPGPPAYSSDTIKAIVAYVGTLGTPGQGTSVPTVEPGDAKEGRSLFLYNCAPCHSSSGTGMIVAGGQFAPELYNTKPTQVAEAIRIGPGPMPEFTSKELTDKEMQDIVSYVGQLGPQQDIGGNGLDEFGPIAEMLVVLLVLVPLMVAVIRLLGKKAPK
jgi:ubiquinol-cytochrome c reductase cytochrome c subunit